MLKFILRRLLGVIPVVFIIVTIIFFLIRLAPGDPAEIMLGLYANDQSVNQLRHELGLDLPLSQQYFSFIANLLRGDLGLSFRTDQPVINELAKAFPPTLQLAIASLLVALLFGLPAGLISATRRYSVFDHIFMFLAIIGVSMPVFWSGLLLMQFFSLYLGWLPVSGYGTWRHLVMPALAISAQTMAFIARLVRSEMLEILHQDYIRTARAKGLVEILVTYKHALPNAILPTITTLGMQFGKLLAGTVIIETIFAWPGLGRLMITSINARDFYTIQGSVILLAVIFVVVNLIVDILYCYLDPRIKYN